MEGLFEIIEPFWFKRGGASAEQIGHAEAALKVQFPPDYWSFLSWSNGGEGQIGSRYLSIWSSDEIRKLNDDYQIGRYLPGVVGIGTDGGSLCYALDYRANAEVPRLVQCALGDLDLASIVLLAPTFRSFIKASLSFSIAKGISAG
jgi:hypothetical protein